MSLGTEIKTLLLGAIETDSLVFLCGAGLSMAEPSWLPSAATVARTCYDKWSPIETLDRSLRDDLDKLAGHFFTRGDFEKVFLKIVPWNELVGQPNKGHAAIADLLISRAAHTALSANFDPIIERWAEERKIALQGALSGHEAVTFSSTSNPLVKFHGCLQRSREKTLWTTGQLTEATIRGRISSCSAWMNLHLPGKDLVVIGFWTDWGYLNDVLANAFSIDNAHSVTVVDPSPTADLETKAPVLWGKLNALSHKFEHIRASGADFLDDLRKEYSKTWVRKFYDLAAPLAGSAPPAEATPDGSSTDALYDLRRDAQGVPYTRAASLKTPQPDSAQAAYCHVQLINSGAVKRGAWLEHGGHTIRIVNGAGQGLKDVQERYKEPSTIPQSDIVICVGAIQLGVPARVIASGTGASFMRPAPGSGSLWLTYEEAQTNLGI